MATAYTTLLGFALPVTGDLSGTWGSVVNNSITQLAEDAIAGVATQSVTSGDWTLTTTGGGVSNEARKSILIATGTPGTTRSILAPNKSKAYVVVNQSNASVVLKGSTGPTTGATITAGTNAICAWNGSDFIIVSGAGDVTLTGTQTLTNKTLTTPVVNGYTEGVVTANTGTAYTIDISVAGLQILTLTGNCTFTFPTATAGKSFTLFLKQDGTGGRTTTFPAAVKWPSSTTPTLTTTASKGDKLVFTADGTYWWGSVAGLNYL